MGSGVGSGVAVHDVPRELPVVMSQFFETKVERAETSEGMSSQSWLEKR